MPELTDRRGEIVESKRPWGRFEQFALNEPATVKVITVEPGHRLSLQRHQHRSELWQVLDGPLDIEVDGRTWTAPAGERVWVPRGATHRLGNSGLRAGRVLEVAFGEFDEDDIERLDDDYAR
ncbi:MAG TPA: phosphomannose isomerase type II C-terminal cupin domain [Segeticoccus sp.]|uniref:phosphomannose isomerase type II C-terminal cupin domain n=1 Tax=Segeticoccus sp. TaxID=2706531 RepID=UPI002D8059F3|nr:phosphomannose isomerase type II C-terminal cupin domain [Segeticoccus sp.]HET8601309.1 phosphomannose isomerase type II C-terminal cupin domain [Segeticoccus sp.]